jgi:hypothetical protein
LATISLVVNAWMALAPFFTSFAFLILQSKGWSKLHILELVGVYLGLHSHMNVARLNSWYKHQWNGALQVGHQHFMCIGVIKNGGYNICGHVFKVHPPLGPKGLRHTSQI